MPRDFVPHDYQREVIDWITSRKRCAVWAPMGGGKTVSTLTALERLSVVEDVYPALVLAPLRVAKSTWPDEREKWSHLAHLRVSVISGTPKQRERAALAEADVYATNYEQLDWLVKFYGDRWPFKTVVADEFTRLKSFRIRQGGSRAAALGKVAHTYVNRFIGLTGTPAPNGIVDLWGQTWFLDKGERLGRTFSAFQQRWFRLGYDGFSLQPYEHTQREVQEVLGDICLTVKGLDVEEPLVNPVWIDIPRTVRDLYATMEKNFYAEIEGNVVEAANAAVKTQKLLQLANGAMYVDEEHNWESVHDAKLDALKSVIEEANGAPVLVAYHFKHDLARLRRAFPKARLLDADPDTIREWNAGRISLLLAHPACLTPQTEVLTETRGWVRIIEVGQNERVHDGVDFVAHKGCFFSGIKPVISVFGIGMTPDHKLLVGGKWVEALDVRDSGRTAGEARYRYAGDDPRLRAMLDLRDGTGGPVAEREPCEPLGPGAMQTLPKGYVSQDDGDAHLADMERRCKPHDRSEKQGLRYVWGRWARPVRGLAALRKLLPRYARGLRGRPDDRSDRQLQGLLPGQLPLGAECHPAGQQEQQPFGSLSRARRTLGRVLPGGWGEPWCHHPEAERRDGRGRGPSGLPEVYVQEGPEVTHSPVYDLVDCGPRNRFLIRNDKGEVFISHNSAGHGLNLADGGNILAFYGVNWNLEEYMQIIERIGPMRQKQAGHERPCLVYPILARNTMDEVVMERLSSKRSVQDILLEAMKRREK